jgi:hypothetical protein
MNIRYLSLHAIEQYCLRVYNDIKYSESNPEIANEILENIRGSFRSSYSPREFFRGDSSKGIKARDITLFENNGLLFAVRKKVLVTVLSVPKKDRISDFFLQLKNN